jgi:hypothetical protein
LLALLPDGRLCAIREFETTPTAGLWTGNDYEDWTSTEVKNPRVSLVGEGNWISAASGTYDIAGVRSDGSLWSVTWWETVDGSGPTKSAGLGNWPPKNGKLRQAEAKATRIGNDSDWSMVAAGGTHFLALKRDGTLWGWGDNKHGQLGATLPDTVKTPAKIGSESDWEFIAAFSSGSIAVKRDHSVWKWGQAYQITNRGIGKGFIGGTPQNIATLPDKATQIISSSIADVFSCEDGSGWGLGQLESNYLGYGNQSPMVTELQKLWGDGKWVDIQEESSIVITAIKKDGTLWRQGDWRNPQTRPRPEPSPIGSRNDWIAVRTYYGDNVFALAKDGTLCRFGDDPFSRDARLTAPSRRVTWSVNVLDAMK